MMKLDNEESVHACMHTNCFKPVPLFATLWTIAGQASLSMGFFWQEYWSGLRCPPPGDLPNPGVKPTSLTSPALAGGFSTTSTICEARPEPLVTSDSNFLCAR